MTIHNRGMTNRTGPVMNSQMNVSLPVELHEQLRDLAWQERKPLSHLCRELIDLGLQKRREQETETAGVPR